jgi:hypothetical protein
LNPGLFKSRTFYSEPNSATLPDPGNLRVSNEL